MDVFKRSDLQYTYTWSPDHGDNPKLRGEPDSSLLDRNEGYEVLYMINKFLSKKNSTSVTLGKAAEYGIRNNLPGSQRSQLHVIEWLMSNIS